MRDQEDQPVVAELTAAVLLDEEYIITCPCCHRPFSRGNYAVAFYDGDGEQIGVSVRKVKLCCREEPEWVFSTFPSKAAAQKAVVALPTEGAVVMMFQQEFVRICAAFSQRN